MRARRRVTETPTGIPSRTLKEAIDLRRAADVRLLAGDRRQLLGRGLEHLRVLLRLADAHVEGDLLQARRLHRASSSRTCSISAGRTSCS